METDTFASHYHAYVVSNTPVCHVILHSNLYSPLPIAATISCKPRSLSPAKLFDARVERVTNFMLVQKYSRCSNQTVYSAHVGVSNLIRIQEL